jgi:hypothetical protein
MDKTVQNMGWANPTPAGLVALAIACFGFFALLTGLVTPAASPLLGCWLLGGFVVQVVVGIIDLKGGNTTGGNTFIFFSAFFMLVSGGEMIFKFFMANSKINASINRKMAKIPRASSRFVAEDFEIISHIDLTPGEVTVLSGPPLFVNAVAVLLDTSKDAKGLNDLASYMIKNIHVEFPDGTSKDVDTGLKLLIFISDMVSPRASVSLPDLIKMHGMRPLNVVVHNESVKIVLVDPNGAWISNAPKMKVTIGYIQTI